MPFDAVEQVVVAISARGRLDRVDVGAGSLLGDRVALVALASRRWLDVPLKLVCRRDGWQPRGRCPDHPGEGVRDAANLLLNEDLLQGRASAAAELRRQV